MKLQKSILTAIFTLFMTVIYAQKPSVAPKGDHEPIDFTQPENIVIYIVLPIVIVILYFMWKAKNKKEREERANK